VFWPHFNFAVCIPAFSFNALNSCTDDRDIATVDRFGNVQAPNIYTVNV